MAPHFFKIILSSEPRLRLPKKFVREYGDNLPSLIFLEAPTGPIWQVQLTRSNGEAWLEKGFQQFKEYYSIGFGYFLVFRYDEDFCFHVLIFDTSATEIEYPYTALKQKRQNNMFDGSNLLKEEVDSDNSVEILEGIPNWQKARNKENVANSKHDDVSVEVVDDFSTKRNAKRKRREVGDDVSVEILDGFPTCKRAMETPKIRSSKVKAEIFHYEEKKAAKVKVPMCKRAMETPKIRSSKVKAEIFHCEEKKAATVKVALADHRSKSIQNKRVNLKKAQADAVPPYFKQEIKKECNAGTGHHLQRPISGSEQTVVAKDKFISYQRAKAFKSKNPFFIAFMQPSYVSRCSTLSFGKIFALKHLSNQKCCDVVLRVPNGRTWKTKCSIGETNAKLRWKKFVMDNGLHVGDACVFEWNTKRSFLNVIIYRTIEDAKSCLHRNTNSVNKKMKSSH